MVDNASQWKQKYYDNLDDMERREKQWNDLEDVFKQAISRLSLVSEGKSKNLDNELVQLRTALRMGKDNQIVRTILENVTREIIKLDRLAQSEPTGDAGLLLKIIEQMQLNGKVEKKSKKLLKLLNSRTTPEQKELISLFCDLLSDVIAQSLEDELKNNSQNPDSARSGFLSGLFVRHNKETEESQDKSTTVAVSTQKDKPEIISSDRDKIDLNQEQISSVVATVQNVLESIIDGMEMNDTVKEQLKDKVFAVKPTREIHVLLGDLRNILKDSGIIENCDDFIQDVEHHHEMLIRLIEFLPLEDSVKEKAEQLKNEFSSGVSTDELPQALQAIAELIGEMRKNVHEEQKEFERFLKNLTGRLQQVDAFLQNNFKEQQQSYQSSMALDNAVKDQVKGIGDSVSSLDSLDDVEAVVQAHLDTIINHINQHRIDEDERVTRIEAQNSQLTRQLKELEAQSGELRQQVMDSQNRAMQDALTGLPNRMAYEQRMQQEYARWKRYHSTLLIMVWDIDFFKQVNDTYGHQAGDKVLKVVGQLLQKNLRETDFVARFGGEEFVSLMPETTLGGGFKVAEKIRSAIEKLEFHYRDSNVKVTISCGINLFVDNDTPEMAFAKADKALYQAKEQGRNRCVIAQTG